jgi:hypothetical protein
MHPDAWYVKILPLPHTGQRSSLSGVSGSFICVVSLMIDEDGVHGCIIPQMDGKWEGLVGRVRRTGSPFHSPVPRAILSPSPFSCSGVTP